MKSASGQTDRGSKLKIFTTDLQVWTNQLNLSENHHWLACWYYCPHDFHCGHNTVCNNFLSNYYSLIFVNNKITFLNLVLFKFCLQVWCSFKNKVCKLITKQPTITLCLCHKDLILEVYFITIYWLLYVWVSWIHWLHWNGIEIRGCTSANKKQKKIFHDTISDSVFAKTMSMVAWWQ
jgi:hypothetical protein